MSDFGKLLNTQQAAKHLNCSPTTVLSLIQQDRLFAYKYQRGYLIPEASIRYYIWHPSDGPAKSRPYSPRELQLVREKQNLVKALNDVIAIHLNGHEVIVCDLTGQNND